MLSTSKIQKHQIASLGEEAIVDRIYEAVIEQLLPPGTKLSESALCEAFGVGRMRIRRSLLLLASRNIVDLESNRGAYVSSPTPEQAREVFQARCVIEPNVCRIAAACATDESITELEKHLEIEQAAHSNSDRRLAIRLSGAFHVKLSEIPGNQILAQTVKELITRTSLIIGFFGAAGTANCHADEHLKLVDALRNKKKDQAAQLMVSHLEHIEAQIDLSADRKKNVDLIGMFSQGQVQLN